MARMRRAYLKHKKASGPNINVMAEYAERARSLGFEEPWWLKRKVPAVRQLNGPRIAAIATMRQWMAREQVLHRLVLTQEEGLYSLFLYFNEEKTKWFFVEDVPGANPAFVRRSIVYPTKHLAVRAKEQDRVYWEPSVTV